MTNLKQLATELRDAAAKATRPKIMACPKCDSTAPPDWTERSPDGDSQCSSCKKPSANWAWVKQAPVPFHPDPTTILALCNELERLQSIFLFNEHGNEYVMVCILKEKIMEQKDELERLRKMERDGYDVVSDINEKARTFLSKWVAPTEGEK